MEETIVNTVNGPSPGLEAEFPLVVDNQQAVNGSDANKPTGLCKENPPSVLTEADHPVGPRPIPKGSTSHSRNRGRPTDRSRSRGRGFQAGGAARSQSRAKSVRASTVAGQSSSQPQGQTTQGPTPRTWANIARVQTKGYNLQFVPPIEENGEVIVDITPDIVADRNPL